jgi:hypothetical protein
MIVSHAFLTSTPSICLRFTFNADDVGPRVPTNLEARYVNDEPLKRGTDADSS